MGPQTRREPLVVANGEEERKPEARARPTGRGRSVERPPCRTTTPLGSPGRPRGVHDVGDVVGAEALSGTSVSSGERRSAQPTVPPAAVLTTVGTAARTSSVHLAAQDDRGPGVPQDPGQLGGPEPGQERDGHRPGLVDRHVRDEPLERLVVADERARPGRRGRSPRSARPRASRLDCRCHSVQGELGAVGQVPPRHAVGERPGQLGQQLGLEQRHAGAPAGHQ